MTRHAIAAFLSAALLFFVQPLAAKRLLPHLGGAPAVWSTSVVFFQTALLAGHAYAHGAIAALGVRRQRILHIALLACGVLALWPALGAPESADVHRPIRAVLVYLGAAVGLPFFVLSATSPLLQRWIGRPDPYALFAASNAGSLFALLAYPLVFEPLFGADTLVAGWKVTFVGWAALMVSLRAQRSEEPLARVGAVPARELLWWITCGFLPSGLLLAVTETITADVAPVPLLWVVPLALYLLSFVLVFTPRRPLDASRLAPYAPLALVPAVPIVLFRVTSPIGLMAGYHLAALLLVSLVFHGELARRRPAAEQLTVYYLALAAGGVLGGMFVTFAAPSLWTSHAEHPLLIALACALLPAQGTRVSLLAAAGVALASAAVIAFAETEVAVASATVGYAPFAILVLPYLLSPRRPVAFGRGLALLLAAGLVLANAARPRLYAGRSFFSSYEVVADKARRVRFLVHGTTVHGAQSEDPDKRNLALPYYPPNSPVEDLFAVTASASQVAILGLGAGALATYARPHQRFVFFEIDPRIEDIARDASLFTFLRDCGGRCDVEIGDGRLLLAAKPGATYGAIVANAFSSHAVPVHLLTREAILVMFAKLAPGGVAAFNITNRHLDLEPLLAAHAAALRLAARVRSFEPEEAGLPGMFVTRTRWFVLARGERDLGTIAVDPKWHAPRQDPSVAPWTDDRASVVAVLATRPPDVR